VSAWELVSSSNVDALRYHPETQTLDVRFRARVGTEGPAYRYSPVSSLRFEQIRMADSIGRAVNALKNDAGVDCSRLEGPDIG
jgi:hypothetical protein